MPKGKPKHTIVWILDKNDLQKNEYIVKQFFKLYVREENFPDKNEKEAPELIIKRVKNPEAQPATFLLAYTVDKKVRGGCIMEYYSRSECCLLTYLFVDPRYRGGGIARSLIEADKEKGIPGLIQTLKSEGRNVRTVFFEVNNPLLTPAEKDSIPPAVRLKIFKRLGGKMLDMDYVQPSLGTDQQPVNNLYLCTFPRLNENSQTIEITTVMRFLVEFYQGLNALKGHFDEEFTMAGNKNPVFKTIVLNKIYNSISKEGNDQLEFIYPESLPTIEEPLLLFDKASICFEILINENHYRLKAKDEPLRESSLEDLIRLETYDSSMYCEFMHSFEIDLLNHSHQDNPPFYTRHIILKKGHTVKIRFPQRTRFVSEGRRETLYVLDHGKEVKEPEPVKNQTVVRELELNVFLNYTYFPDSNIRVWHLVFASFQDCGLNEFDIIKLVKFFGGRQESPTEEEKNQALGEIKFVPVYDHGPKNELNVFELFEELSGITYTKKDPKDKAIPNTLSFTHLKSGIVHIDTGSCRFTHPSVNQEHFENVFKHFYQGEPALNHLTSAEEHYFDYTKKAICGIISGILDFRRMNDEEVRDTLLRRSATQNSFLLINRGLLGSITHRDDTMAEALDTLGMSPYLLIPGAVLAQNEYISIDAFAKSRKHVDNAAAEKIRELEKGRNEILRLLNVSFLRNVFQYPTERDLYEFGIAHRGMPERNFQTHANLAQINTIIDEKNAHENDTYQFSIGILLLIISVFSIYDPVASLMINSVRESSNVDEKDIRLLTLWALIAISLLVSVFLYFRKQSKTRRK